MCNKEMDKVAHWVAGHPIGPRCYLKKFGSSIKLAHEVVKVNQPELFGENMKTLKVKKLHPDAIIPKYQTSGAACFDIHAINSGFIFSCDSGLFATGLSFEVPEGYVMLVYSRSGHGFNHGVRLSNCVGVIDSDYRGELMVRLQSDKEGRSDNFIVNKGDRIAQAMLIPVDQWSLEEVSELSDTERGVNGLGSTGAK